MGAMSKEISKLLSYVLRHAPESLGVALDAGGWTSVEQLIAKAQQAGHKIDRAILETVVAESDKKRFTLSADGQLIRAAQGHSVSVELGLTPSEPPEILFHGTERNAVDPILAEGLKPGRRQHVHLSLDENTAVAVGSRHGKAVALRVAAGRMHADGFQFWRADNGVWLTDHVPPVYIGT